MLRLGFYLSASLLFASSSMADDYCRQWIEPADHPVLQYKLRQNRCEGLVKTPVSTSPAGLRVVDFSSRKLAGNPPPEALVIGWTGKQEVHIRAISGEDHSVYRMDTIASTGNSFVWPLDVFFHNNVGLGVDDILTLGCLSNCGNDKPTMIPLNVTSTVAGQPVEAPGDQNLVMTFDSQSDLSRVYLTIREPPETRISSHLFEEEITGSQGMSRHQLLRFSWPSRFGSGEFEVELAAEYLPSKWHISQFKVKFD